MQAFNPTGLRGIAFVEYAGGAPEYMEGLFMDFGFSKLKKHKSLAITYFNQNHIHFLYNTQKEGFAHDFSQEHGPSICSMGFLVEDAKTAFDAAVSAGARPYQGSADSKSFDCPAIYGIGDSLIYFLSDIQGLWDSELVDLDAPLLVEEKGFIYIDHLTNNVYKGTMQQWADFYKDVFGFKEIRYFDIKGEKTGLTSYALKSPCGTFSIPINEGNEEKSQIEEYLREYKGPGIQHLAFLTHDLLDSLDKLKGSSIKTLDINPGYYDIAFNRVPNITEDKQRIRDHKALVDGDDEGYLLQIFTENLVGPIFIEMIQRKNHHSFGEGNFQALFNSIERDQERRGVLT